MFCWSQSVNNQYDYYDCKTLFSNNHQETEKKNKGLLLTIREPGNFTAYLGLHSEMGAVKRELEEHGPVFLLVLGLRVGA